MILEMETERPSNRGDLHLVADMGSRRIHEPPPICHQLYKMPYLCTYVTFLKFNGIDVWGQIVLFFAILSLWDVG